MTGKSNHEVRASYPRRYRAQFGENLKKKLKERKISQAALAREMGVSRTCVILVQRTDNPVLRAARTTGMFSGNESEAPAGMYAGQQGTG